VLHLFYILCDQGQGLTGCRNGKVSQGVLDILKELPIVKVGVEHLPELVGNPGRFLCHLFYLHVPKLISLV
jgi:hypothetical protein